MPGLRARRLVDRQLTVFFREHHEPAFRRAIAGMSRFYNLRLPRVEWFEYLDWGKTAGRTWENGHVALVHPAAWKRGRKYNSERQWIGTVYHEMGHYVLWADAERKADLFAQRFVRGVAQNGRAASRSIARGATPPRLHRRPRRSRSR